METSEHCGGDEDGAADDVGFGCFDDGGLCGMLAVQAYQERKDNRS